MAKQSYSDINGRDKAGRGYRKSASGKDRYSADFTSFVNVSLSDHDKSEFETWSRTAALPEVMELQAQSGIKFGVGWDFKSGCGLATAMCRDTESVNTGRIVSARGADLNTALWRVVFLVECYLGDDWALKGLVTDPNRW